MSDFLISDVGSNQKSDIIKSEIIKLEVMKNITTIQSLLSSFILRLTGKATIDKNTGMRPVENEELFDHLFID